MTPTTDDRELLRTLAQACGWRVEPLPENGCTVIMPDGAKALTMYNEIGTWDSIIESRMIPDWLHSVDEALAMPWPMGYRLDIDTCATDTDVWLHNVAEYPIRATAPTLARALCEVFAQWWRENHHDNK